MTEFSTQDGGNIYEGGVTTFGLVTCMVAAMGGLIFGYDIGISGGVTSMEPFLSKFFPSVHERMNNDMNRQNQYCKFNSQLLTLFTSSLYISALVSAFFASNVTRAFGRKVSMFFGGIVFLIGCLLNGLATNIKMLIIGRILLGIGIGFNNQSIPVYLSEMAPATLRGALNMGFQFCITIGILIANLVNYCTAQIEGGWGWRVSLALAAVPALIMTVGSLFLVETPISILERGQMEQARQTLQKLRGTDNVENEFQELINASQAANKVQYPWKHIIQPKYRPQLVVCILIPFFQQLTAINVVMFYTPVLFKTLGFGDEASLISAVSTGAINVFATIIAIFSVDRCGRRALFLEGGLQMMVCQIAIGVLIGMEFGLNGEGDLSKSDANLILFLICTYVAAFAWSWGPLGWLIPSEICPLEIRSAGQALSVSVNMFFTFAIAQSFLPMLCHMKFGIFFFFAGFVILMTVVIYLLLPETKNVPIEEMNTVWKEHWFWGKYFSDDYLF